MYCIITGLYIPILSGGVLIFTGLRIRATLRRRRSVQIRLRQHNVMSQTTSNVDDQPSGTSSTVRRFNTFSSRRTLKILTFTSMAYFTFWSPYVVVTLTQCFVSSFQPPSGVEFAVMWLANSNSAVNVFIYSSTNTQFRRQCVRLASRLCCSRLFCSSSSEHTSSTNRGNAAAILPAINLQAPAAAETDFVDAEETSFGDKRYKSSGVKLLTVPGTPQFLSVDNMKEAVSIESLSFDEDDQFL